jgi:hypothetical protein
VLPVIAVDTRPLPVTVNVSPKETASLPELPATVIVGKVFVPEFKFLLVIVAVPLSTYLFVALSVGTAWLESPPKVSSVLNSLIVAPNSAPIEPSCNSDRPDKSKASAFNVAIPVDC